jgi:3D (Asp-Asp-Asp) domain-containing protein
MLRCAVMTAAVLAVAPRATAEDLHPRRVQATAYCQTGTTASGTITRRGVIAADPRVFPMGTLVHLDVPLPGYSGTYRVEDTGRGVKGHVLDIYMPSCAAAKRFGRRRVTARIVRPGAVEQVAQEESLDPPKGQ